MTKAYFWILFFTIASAAGYWKLLFVGMLLNLINYFCFLYEPAIQKNDYKVCIVGAGFSGIGAAVRLKKLGIDYEIFEASDDIGGTWSQNVNPGCACDVQSHVYSFAFEPNAHWSRKYSGQEEILRYLKFVVEKYKLKINLNTKVTRAKWDKAKQSYKIEFEGEKLPEEANFIISGAGALREPVFPSFPGMQDFEGDSFHSTFWSKNTDVKDKRVAIIGTGASAVQIVPNICNDVKELHVFQRTPCWSPPRFDAYYPSWLKLMYEYIPGLLYLNRLRIFAIMEFRYFGAFRSSGFLTKLLRSWIENHIKATVKNPDLAAALTPNYSIGCKRITPSDTYLNAFNCPNVRLITDKIEKITPSGIKTADGTVSDFDIIVYATGFSVLNSLRNSFELVNEYDVSLNDVIQDNPRAFLGVTFPKFPNFFVLLGPQTGLGHNSVVWMIECSTNHIIDCIRKMADKGIAAISAKETSLQEFQATVQDYMENKVFYQGCLSWYRNKGGAGVNYALWPSHLLHYWWLTRKADLDDYEYVISGKQC